MPLLPASTPPLTTSTPPSYEEFNVPLRQPTSGNASKSQTKLSPPTSATTKKRRRKKKKRLIDESRVFEPTDNDVLFGRGGFTNTHPGNIKVSSPSCLVSPSQ